MSKLNQEELSRQVEMWLLGCTHDTEIPYEGCKKCPSKKECKQANRQIKKLIQKPEVTEERIEEKAKKMKNIVISFFAPGSQVRWMADPFERCKDFIRSLVGEIK